MKKPLTGWCDKPVIFLLFFLCYLQKYSSSAPPISRPPFLNRPGLGPPPGHPGGPGGPPPRSPRFPGGPPRSPFRGPMGGPPFRPGGPRGPPFGARPPFLRGPGGPGGATPPFLSHSQAPEESESHLGDHLYPRKPSLTVSDHSPGGSRHASFSHAPPPQSGMLSPSWTQSPPLSEEEDLNSSLFPKVSSNIGSRNSISNQGGRDRAPSLTTPTFPNNSSIPHAGQNHGEDNLTSDWDADNNLRPQLFGTQPPAPPGRRFSGDHAATLPPSGQTGLGGELEFESSSPPAMMLMGGENSSQLPAQSLNNLLQPQPQHHHNSNNINDSSNVSVTTWIWLCACHTTSVLTNPISTWLFSC